MFAVLAEAIVLPWVFGAGVRDVIVYGLGTMAFLAARSNHRFTRRAQALRQAQTSAAESNAVMGSAVG